MEKRHQNSHLFLFLLLFLLFFFSGFCGLLYQVVWLRKAFAAFGVITPVLSIVLSTFMLGLALGSWIGGKWGEAWREWTGSSPILLYGITELLIGLGAFVVPHLFLLGTNLLLFLGESHSWEYLLFSALIISISILPWCIFMGMTFPVMMGFMKESVQGSESSFSFLYLANVIGAMAGTGLTAGVLIELFGFQTCLAIAAACNFAIALVSFSLGIIYHKIVLPKEVLSVSEQSSALEPLSVSDSFFFLAVLFMTGFCAMAMEVVWTRAFIPILRTTIYSFAFLLVLYLFGTWFGSAVYRWHLRRKKLLQAETLLGLSLVFIILTLPLNDFRIHLWPYFRLHGILLSVIPFCAVLGYLTPYLIDRYSKGAPFQAGKAYAINIIGCILGPLFAGYLLLPFFGIKWGLLILTIPFLGFFIFSITRGTLQARIWAPLLSAGLILIFVSAVFNITYEERTQYKPKGEELSFYKTKKVEVRRDYTATVISEGKGLEKRLLVNGMGMTGLTTITKTMAHLPMFTLEKPPRSAIVICFGMGTTYRSLMSWNIDVTAVELVPSVKDAFGFYFDDAESVMKRPNGKIVIDDGRRYLQRNERLYDVITIDPPPPVVAAGSSLLYSVEFYELIKKRLKKGGILQHWCPQTKGTIPQAIARSLFLAFPYVKMFHSIEGEGYHFLASMEPIAIPSTETALARMPVSARDDLTEWFSDGRTVRDVIDDILSRPVPKEALHNPDPRVLISDDRPYNEYYLIRRALRRMRK